MDPDTSPCPVPLAVVTRGGLLESIHRGHFAHVDSRGNLLSSLGDKDFPTFFRSAAKPFQALAVLETGAAAAFGVSPAELALMCGSVSGQDYHVAAVRSVLKKAGLDESCLLCGSHRPSHRQTAREMDKRGEKPLPVHNNCAGKHAAMLLICRHLGFPVEEYIDRNHPVQTLIKDTVAELCGLASNELGVGIDGCGVPVFRAPLWRLAYGYARLADPDGAGFGPDRCEAVKTLMDAALAHPEMIAGDERVCTEMMRAAPGRFLAKTGAEASYAASLMESASGCAFKIEDGSQRAIGPAAVEMLFKLGLIPEEKLDSLSNFIKAPVKNHRGEVVGTVEPYGRWEQRLRFK